MSKMELIDAISEETGSSKSDATKHFDAVVKVILDKLVQGERVQIPDIGILEVGFRAERKGRNPKTGEEITIKASRVAKFKASKKLKDALQD